MLFQSGDALSDEAFAEGPHSARAAELRESEGARSIEQYDHIVPAGLQSCEAGDVETL